MARYGKKAEEKVHAAMKELKAGTLESGRSGKKVTSEKQAIAIGLAEARREGGKVPKAPEKRSPRSSSSAKSRSRKSTRSAKGEPRDAPPRGPPSSL